MRGLAMACCGASEALRLPIQAPIGTRLTAGRDGTTPRAPPIIAAVESTEGATTTDRRNAAGGRADQVQPGAGAARAHPPPSALPLDGLLAERLDGIAEILHSDTAAILLLDEEANVVVARAAKGIEEEVEQGVRIPVGRGFAGRVAAERRPIVLTDVDHADVLNPILREKGIRSLLGVPLLVEGRVLGVLHVGTLTLREFTAYDVDVLQLAADRIAVAIDHARLYESERRAAEQLRRLET